MHHQPPGRHGHSGGGHPRTRRVLARRLLPAHRNGLDGQPQRTGSLLGSLSRQEYRISPAPEDELAELLRAAYGGDANIETMDNGMDIWVRPTSGGWVLARVADVNSPALLGVFQVR